MSKLKAFFYVYWKSVSSIAYYTEVLYAKTSFSVKYFAMFATLLAIFGTTVTSYTAIPYLTKTLRDLTESAKNMYPNDLEFVSQDNKWTVNREEPFIIATPEYLKGKNENNQESMKENPTEKMPNNIVVFYHNGTIDDFNKLDTLALVNSTNLLVKDTKGFKTYPLEKLPIGKLDKTVFVQNVDKLSGLTKVISFLTIGFILVTELLRYFILGAIYLLSTTFYTWLLGRATKLKPNFNESARITIHTATIPFTIEIILGALNQTIPVAWWFTLSNLLLAMVIMIKLHRVNEREVLIPQVIQ